MTLINHTFLASDGQGRVNAEVMKACIAAGITVRAVGAVIPEAWKHNRSVDGVLIDVPRSWPTPLRHQVFAWRVWQTLRRLKPEGNSSDLLILNGAMTYSPADVNLCHFVHSAWGKSSGHDWTQSRSLRSAYQRCVTAFNAWWERIAYRQATRIVAVSESIRDDLIRHAGIDASKIEVIPNGVDVKRFNPTSGDSSSAKPHELVLGFCGGLRTRRKNLDVILNTMKCLSAGVTLQIAGNATGGPYPDMVSQLGLEDRVRFLGPVDDMPAFYRSCDAFVLASHYEPWGLVVTEAMACGIPVVVSRNVGAACVVRDSENGLVIDDPSDVQGLTSALKRLAADPAGRRTMGAAARETALTLDWSIIGRCYVELFSRVLEEKQSSASALHPGTQPDSRIAQS